jgi:hypothetical protein
MSPDPIAQIAALGVEPTYSAREAATLLGRSYSWLDQGLRGDGFTLPDGTKVEPRRTAGRYRRFTLAMLEDIALSSYRHHWFSMNKLKSTYRELLMAAYRETGGPRSRAELHVARPVRGVSVLIVDRFRRSRRQRPTCTGRAQSWRPGRAALNQA